MHAADLLGLRPAVNLNSYQAASKSLSTAGVNAGVRRTREPPITSSRTEYQTNPVTIGSWRHPAPGIFGCTGAPGLTRRRRRNSPYQSSTATL
jgi:hypothetical protein